MNVEFFDGLPHAEFGPRMLSLLAGAKRIDAAIAFVTQPGTKVLRKLLGQANPPRVRLVASVRYPTNLEELDRLAQRLPGNVWIHTGFLEPREAGGERGQFHSKIVLAELEGDERLVIVGSHNWTQNALEGHNLEAGLIVRCREPDDIVRSARRHIEACIAESQPFDAKEMRFYQTIQRELHTGPSGAASEDFPGFEDFESLIIHAEDGTSAAVPERLQLFVPIRDGASAAFFFNDRNVQLYLYPQGTLHGCEPPQSVPVLYEGTITMVNALRDAPVDRRQANCRIDDIGRPVLDLLPGNLPPPSGEIRQVMMRLDARGAERLPIFHGQATGPKVQLSISYVERDRGDYYRGQSEESVTLDGRRSDSPLPRDGQEPAIVKVPHHLVVGGTVKVPNRWLYAEDVERQLTYALNGSNLWTQRDELSLIVDPATKEVLNRYVYGVHHRFTKEAYARAEQQMKLFEQ